MVFPPFPLDLEFQSGSGWVGAKCLLDACCSDGS